MNGEDQAWRSIDWIITTGLSYVPADLAATQAAVSDLAALGSYVARNPAVHVLGKRGGVFYFKPGATEAADGVFVVDASDTDGKWLRLNTFPLRVEWFGAEGDGSTDDYAAFMAALASADSRSTPLSLFDATYQLSARLVYAASNKLVLEGAGSDLTKLRWGDAGGIKLSFPSQHKAPTIKGITFSTTGAGTPQAIEIDCPPIGSAFTMGVYLADIEIYGEVHSTDYWLDGIYLSNCWYITVTDFTIKGKDEAALPFSMGSGIKLNACQVPYIWAFTMQHMEVGIIQEGSVFGEGLNIGGQFEMVGVRVGVDYSSVTTHGIAIQGIQDGHINAYERCIKLRNIVQGEFAGLLLYKTHISESAFVGVELNGGVNNCNFDLKIFGSPLASGGMTGMTVTEGKSNRIRAIFDFWEAEGSGIVIGTAAAGNIVESSIGGNQGAAIHTVVINSDAGAGNKIISPLRNGAGGSAIINNATSRQFVHDPRPLPDQMLTANSTTPSIVAISHPYYSTANSASTLITDFLGAAYGDEIDVFINDVMTGFKHDLTKLLLKGGVDVAVGSAAGVMISFRYDGSRWVEKSRSF